MAANKVTLKLTPDQQKHIKDSTGQDVTELHLEPVAAGELSERELDTAVGGLVFTFKLVAVKTIS